MFTQMPLISAGLGVSMLRSAALAFAFCIQLKQHGCSKFVLRLTLLHMACLREANLIRESLLVSNLHPSEAEFLVISGGFAWCKHLLPEG